MEVRYYDPYDEEVKTFECNTVDEEEHGLVAGGRGDPDEREPHDKSGYVPYENLIAVVPSDS